VEEARGWREATRASFTRLLASGYKVAGFYEDDTAGWYVLTRC
jgi:predicted GNAT superfamily acetyltransferase